MTITPPTHAKICRTCFIDIFGTTVKVQTITWGVECARCMVPTPSRAVMAKVSAEVVDKNPYMTPFGPIMTRAQLRAEQRKKMSS